MRRLLALLDGGKWHEIYGRHKSGARSEGATMSREESRGLARVHFVKEGKGRFINESSREVGDAPQSTVYRA